MLTTTLTLWATAKLLACLWLSIAIWREPKP